MTLKICGVTVFVIKERERERLAGICYLLPWPVCSHLSLTSYSSQTQNQWTSLSLPNEEISSLSFHEAIILKSSTFGFQRSAEGTLPLLPLPTSYRKNASQRSHDTLKTRHIFHSQISPIFQPCHRSKMIAISLLCVREALSMKTGGTW